MALYAFNKTGAPLPLAAGNPIVTLPASPTPPTPGKPYNVTSELRPNLTVDPVNGKAGGLAAGAYALLQAQVGAGSVVYEWTSDPEYATASLVVGGPDPGPHAPTHQPGGSDPMAVDAAAGTGSLRTIGAGALQACAGNDARLSDARTPTAHASSHVTGADQLADAIAGGAHGLMTGADKTKADATTPANIPSTTEKQALVGTFGAPATGNEYRTKTDPAVALCTTVNMQLYLDMTGGSDANDGLTLLTPKKTFVNVFALIPQFVLHNVTVNVLGASTEIGTVSLERFVAVGKVLLIDGGPLRTVVAGPFTADIASSSSIGLLAASWTPNFFNGYICQILTSTVPAVIPQERTIHRHDATTIVPVRNYSTSPGLGATFQIVQPTTTISTALTLLFRNMGAGTMQVQNFHMASTSSLRVERGTAGGIFFASITVASLLTSGGLVGEPIWVNGGSSLTLTPSTYNPVTWALKGATTDPQCGVGQVLGTGWIYNSCSHLLIGGSFLRIVRSNRGPTLHIFQGTNVQSLGVLSVGNDTVNPLTILNSFVGNYANTYIGGHPTKIPMAAMGCTYGIGIPGSSGPGVLFIPSLDTVNWPHAIESIASDARLDSVAGFGFAGLGVYAHCGGSIQTRPGFLPTLNGALGCFGFKGVQATLKPSVAVPGSGIDTVVETLAIGVGGNAITLNTVADGAGPGNVSRVGSAITYHYQSGVSTVAGFEAAANLAVVEQLMRVKTPGTGATVLTAPADTFGPTAFSGGSNVVAGGTWNQVEFGARFSDPDEQVVVKKVPVIPLL